MTTDQRDHIEHVRELLVRRARKYIEFGGFILETNVEEYITLFCEGDGHVGTYGPSNSPIVSFAQDQRERDVLDYISSLVPDGHFNTKERRDNVLNLRYHGPHCVPLLEMFSRHVVSKCFLDRLSPILEIIGLPKTTQHSITLDGFVGFWDAEGTSSNAPYISVAQKNREILNLIESILGGGVSHIASLDSYTWTLCGDEARKLAALLMEKSHCPQKVERLRENFEGPSYHEKHKEERKEYKQRYKSEHHDVIQQYYEEHREEYKERQRKYQARLMLTRAYMKEHQERVKELKSAQRSH